jgi:hypothetical protein
VFVGTPSDETLFVGIYSVKYLGELKMDQPWPTQSGKVSKAGSCDEYRLRLSPRLKEYVGKLVINWGLGALQYTQYAHKHDKRIIELRPKFKEDRFPGALNFSKRLSELNALPSGWVSVLMELKGVYLLTCPETGLQYVGKATGEERFWGRWQHYVTGAIAPFQTKPGEIKGIALRNGVEFVRQRK